MKSTASLGISRSQFDAVIFDLDGVVTESAVKWIGALRAAGFKTAIVSSSKNCRRILVEARIGDLFDAQVDGLDSDEIGLDGKPAPDIFLEAARRLGVDPGRAAVIDHATSGVEAGRRGGFKLVIGVDRAGQAQRLKEMGADQVVRDLSDIPIGAESETPDSSDLPSALEHLDNLAALMKRRRTAVFLDYDGTLTPIVERPEDAYLPDLTRLSVERLARHCTVAVVSGRDLPDLRQRVDLDHITYAGSHGFDIKGPDGVEMQNEEGVKFLPILDRAERRLRELTSSVPGAQVERKKFSVAVHYRRVDLSRAREVASYVHEVAGQFEGLQQSEGKKVFELQPKVDWHKGKAVLWLLKALGLNHEGVVPIYIGDDTTDENAFRSLRDHGIGIVVEEGARMTSAQYVLRDTEQVREFIDRLAALLEGERT
jgi:trehalose-phosphatase